MIRNTIISMVLFFFLFIQVKGQWQTKIGKDHPRLFFNQKMLPIVRESALGEEKVFYMAIKDRVDKMFNDKIEIKDYGSEAAEAAFVFLITKEKPYQDFAKRLLSESITFYQECYAKKTGVSNFNFSQINALVAYDWIFNELSEEERRRFGTDLLQNVSDILPTTVRPVFSRNENWSLEKSGFYGTLPLQWYVGLVTHKEGINDELSEKCLNNGYDAHVKMLKFRNRAAGNDGGSSAGALNYAVGKYPFAEFNFFHTFRSSTGIDISKDWHYIANLPGYVFWNWLPGAREFGIGDTYHTDSKINVANLTQHLSSIIYFYAQTNPLEASIAKYLLDKPESVAFSNQPAHLRWANPFSYTKMLPNPKFEMTDLKKVFSKLPLARYFEGMGQTMMRSGNGENDTYAMFVSSGIPEEHKHFDNNSFVIYKKGFQALDAGTRPEPGQHLSHYYPRTVAHNAILIKMPDEKMPHYWGSLAEGEEKQPYPNDGGQNDKMAGKVVAFESTAQFAYVAGDATKAYHQKKCKLALRQFVFIAPNYFVIFDRVDTTEPDFEKRWLIHTATEPLIEGDIFTSSYEDGRLFCRTFLPEKSTMVKIGGPGKQFWSDGKNWSLPQGSQSTAINPLFGQWRIEVSPKENSTGTQFLHLIQVDDVGKKQMISAQLVRKEKTAGVKFETPEGLWEVLFGTDGAPSGHISLKKNGKTELDQELTRKVMEQSGF